MQTNKLTAKDYKRGDVVVILSNSISHNGFGLNDSGAKTPAYINDAACELIQKHKEEILNAIIDFLEKNEKQYRANEFREANGRSAGNGVDFKTSHPSGEAQRNKVRTMMQKNAPEGTNHL